ncbi:uncharacterized protein [Amphiura filiformis]|uniref:uncharacterized protein n=1 Tax=Amphiura filiformis TaxID=82378 RepID=UPI003B21A8E9
MVRDSIASRLEHLPTDHSDRIMSLRIPLQNKQFVTLFSIYAPTLQAEPADKGKFYSDLRSFLQSIPTEDKIFILGDFNARVGRDSDTWKGALGKHGIGNCNDNGRLLLEPCAEQQLVITNTIFQQKDSLKTTWMLPRSKHWHLIDYIITRQSDLKDVLHTRVMPSAECHTDHRLVRCKLNLQFKPKPRKGGPPKRKISVGSLQSSEIKASFQANLQTRIEGSSYSIDSSPEVFWEQLKTTIQQSSEEVLGYTSKKNLDWFDENNAEIQTLMAKKRSALQAHLAQPLCPEKKAAFRTACCILQRELRVSQNKWWTDLAQKTLWWILCSLEVCLWPNLSSSEPIAQY